MSKRSAGGRIRLLILVKLALVLGVVVVGWLLAREMELLESLAGAQSRIESLGAVAVVVYPLVYALCNVLLLPAGVLSVLGGFFFGLWWGFLVVLTGNLLGAAVAFLVSRHLARGLIEARIRRSRRLQALDQAIARDGWKVIFLSQLHPLFPTSLLNYLYGLSRMRFWSCMAWIALGQTPGLFFYVYLGTLGQYGVELLLGERRPAGFEVAFWLSGLALTFVIAWLLGRLALRALRTITGDERDHPQPVDSPSANASLSD